MRIPDLTQNFNYMETEAIEYNNPKDNQERGEDPRHTIEFRKDGKTVGRAEIDYYSKPFPIYQITDLYVEPEYQNEGIASTIMGAIEKMLKEKRKAGVLVDAIDEESEAKGMYSRRGWQEVPEQGGLFAYNLPKESSIDTLRGYALRYTDPLEREDWKKKNKK